MASLMQWLAEPVGIDTVRFFEGFPPPALPLNPTRLELLACLQAMHQGDWGIHTSGVTYCSAGLSQEQALVRLELNSFVQGWLRGTDHREDEELAAAIKAEWARIEALGREPPP